MVMQYALARYLQEQCPKWPKWSRSLGGRLAVRLRSGNKTIKLALISYRKAQGEADSLQA